MSFFPIVDKHTEMLLSQQRLRQAKYDAETNGTTYLWADFPSSLKRDFELGRDEDKASFYYSHMDKSRHFLSASSNSAFEVLQYNKRKAESSLQQHSGKRHAKVCLKTKPKMYRLRTRSYAEEDWKCLDEEIMPENVRECINDLIEAATQRNRLKFSIVVEELKSVINETLMKKKEFNRRLSNTILNKVAAYKRMKSVETEAAQVKAKSKDKKPKRLIRLKSLKKSSISTFKAFCKFIKAVGR